ncbi:GNAT family N-acetyltransferase [Candidatus Pacearchaeota archaeon]|nr:GNAT family N-acetyltransferase [Candidatus Pacearchaeota archaeon]
MKIRKAKNNDLKQIVEAYKKAFVKLGVGEKWTDNSAQKLMQYWLKRQPDLFFVAEINNKIVGGFVAGIKPWWNGNHLVEGELFVHPNYQNLGIGTKLSKIMYQTAIKKYKIINVQGATFKNKKFPLIWHKSKGFSENKNWILIEANPRILLRSLK